MIDRKFSDLEALVASMGNVVEACASLGVSRSWYYKMLKKAGEKATGRRRHPQGIPDQVCALVLELALEYPDWGCNRISHYLKLNGRLVSSTTVQKLLKRRGLRTSAERHGAAAAKAAMRNRDGTPA